MKQWLTWRWTVLPLVAALSGCTSLDYYAQSIGGQWEVWRKSQPINQMLVAPDTPETLRKKLQTVLAIRDFASATMALPNNDSYRHYADLQRPFVVWNVFAAEHFSVSLRRWCFPFAGCVGYRGYFSEADARQFAAQLAAEGMDVYVGGVAAYSTLGWFDDPMLNTILSRSPARLAGLVFHELAHQQLYVEGDTAFNEGFASTVELEGVRRWLAANGDGAQRQAYQQSRQRQNDFVTLVTQARDTLQNLYGKPLNATEMQNQKTAVQTGLRQEYQQLKKQWGGYAGYDAWFAQGVNNAQLAAVTTYRDSVPMFQRLLAKQGGDMAAFYRAAAALGEMPLVDREKVLLVKRSQDDVQLIPSSER